MRTINVKPSCTRIEVLELVASALENDLLDDDNQKGSFDCIIHDDKITQYELDENGDVFNEVVWLVDDQIKTTGLSATVDIDC